MTLFRFRTLSISLVVVSSATLLFFFQRNSITVNTHKKGVPLVTLATVETKQLPLLLRSQGHVVALNQVDIQSQVTGTIQEVNFKEGDFVKKGQLLFRLEDSTQLAALHRAKAAEAQTYAQLVKAKSDVKRGLSLKVRNYLSAAEWDTLKSTEQQFIAQEKAMQEDINSAEVQLGYTRIYAPATGKTGTLQVHPGSLVQPGSGVALVTIKQFDPIGVSFTLPEENLNVVLSAQSQGAVVVSVTHAEGKKVSGVLDFIDNTVNTDTGTILLKAHFANPTHRLWPGAFQNVTLTAGTEQVATLAPQAIQNGPNGHFVYQINKQNKIITKPVDLLRIQQSLAVVKGLDNGEAVVVEGMNNVRPGMLVAVADPGSSTK